MDDRAKKNAVDGNRVIMSMGAYGTIQVHIHRRRPQHIYQTLRNACQRTMMDETVQCMETQVTPIDGVTGKTLIAYADSLNATASKCELYCVVGTMITNEIASMTVTIEEHRTVTTTETETIEIETGTEGASIKEG